MPAVALQQHQAKAQIVLVGVGLTFEGLLPVTGLVVGGACRAAASEAGMTCDNPNRTGRPPSEPPRQLWATWMASWFSTRANARLPWLTTWGLMRSVRAAGSHSPAAPTSRGGSKRTTTPMACILVNRLVMARRSAVKRGGWVTSLRISARLRGASSGWRRYQ